MSDRPSGVGDILGIRPIADAINTVTTASVAGASAFLSRICLPASEEFGLLLRDKVSSWRAHNALKVTLQAEAILNKTAAGEHLHAHPRLVGQILENSSWSDDSAVQEMWAGLLASSCDSAGSDESNLMFIDLLSRLSSSQVRTLHYACQSAKKMLAPNGLIIAAELMVSASELLRIAQLDDLQRLDRELDHLRTLGLLEDGSAGFSTHDDEAGLTPSALMLHMYARSQGHRGNPVAFFDPLELLVDEEAT